MKRNDFFKSILAMTGITLASKSIANPVEKATDISSLIENTLKSYKSGQAIIDKRVSNINVDNLDGQHGYYYLVNGNKKTIIH